MEIPFTLLFECADPLLVRRERRTFVPVYPMPFVGPGQGSYLSGDACQLCYRWHDAYDVFIGLLEARGVVPVSIRMKSHRCDLQLVYQLKGETLIVPELYRRSRPSAEPVGFRIPEGRRMEIYSPPAEAMVNLQLSGAGPYALVVVVPKAGWVTRHQEIGESPMEDLIELLRRQHPSPGYLPPTRITSGMYTWLHLLLSTPPQSGMLLDDALNRSMVRLMKNHRREYLHSAREERGRELVDAARLLAGELVSRMEGGYPPTTGELAGMLGLSVRRLRELHMSWYGQRFFHYIHTCRMEEAKRRLLTGLPVSAVAYQLGWSEATNFSAQFRKHTGLSPREFKTMNQGLPDSTHGT